MLNLIVRVCELLLLRWVLPPSGRRRRVPQNRPASPTVPPPSFHCACCGLLRGEGSRPVRPYMYSSGAAR